MAAILSVTTTRVRDGKQADFLAAIGKVKKAFEGHGAKVRVLSQAYGVSPLTITTVVELASWEAFGAFSEKVEKDAAVQSLLAELRAHPISDITARSVSTELDV